MGGEIVHHVVQRLGGRELRDLASKHGREGFGGVIALALEVHLGIGVVEESEHIDGAVADVLELLEASLVLGAPVRGEALEDLQP